MEGRAIQKLSKQVEGHHATDQNWRLTDPRLAYDVSPWFQLLQFGFVTPSGQSGEYIMVDMPRSGTVVAAWRPGDAGSESEAEILLVREYRAPLGRVIWGLPGGRIDDGETAEQAAARELLEETGYKAQDLRPLVSFTPAAALMRHEIHAFAAHAPQQQHNDFDPDEISALQWTPVGRVLDLIQTGAFPDGPSLIAVQHLLLTTPGLLRL